MTRKTKTAYIALFEYIESNICHLDPSSFMTDFESGMRNAIRHVYPACNLRGCYFHYTQAIRKKGRKIPGFFEAIVKDKAMHRLFRKFLVLPLLPSDKIKSAFDRLEYAAQSFGTTFDEFIKYFKMQWIILVRFIYKYILYTSFWNFYFGNFYIRINIYFILRSLIFVIMPII